MRQGRRALRIGAALAIAMIALAPAIPVARAAAARTSVAAAKSTRSGLRQFTGIVTSLDKTTLTVEKHGKTPRTVVFTRHGEMTTTGEIDKNARVTVYYSEEGGKSIAHRVVAKRPRAASAGS